MHALARDPFLLEVESNTRFDLCRLQGNAT
jgi:hypothetical protein